MMGGWEVVGLALGSSVVYRIVEHLLTRRTSQANLAKNHIENIDLSGETWQHMIDRLESRIETLNTLVGSLQKENITLKEDLYRMQSEITALRQVQKKAERYEKHIKSLEERIAYYERLLREHSIDF